MNFYKLMDKLAHLMRLNMQDKIYDKIFIIILSNYNMSTMHTIEKFINRHFPISNYMVNFTLL